MSKIEFCAESTKHVTLWVEVLTDEWELVINVTGRKMSVEESSFGICVFRESRIAINHIDDVKDYILQQHKENGGDFDVEAWEDFVATLKNLRNKTS